MASILLAGVAIILSVCSASAQPAPGCPTHCGGVEIPYPFGIGARCAKDKGFEINCNNTADGQKPFLINVEVLHINISHGKTRALNHISTYCYSPREMDIHTWSLDFTTGWPYRLSNVDNKFIVLGCNILAYMYNSENRTGYTTACASVCESPGALVSGSCLGAGCCQNAIPKGLVRYDVRFQWVYNDSSSYNFNNCSYAALVETNSFNFSSEYITTMKFNETHKGQQPLVLDWAIGSVACEVAKNMTSYACLDGNSVCVDSTNGPGYLCKCSEGYEGNPYLHDGCTDVNECKMNSSPCPKGARCHNTIGHYRCSCPPGRKLAVHTNSCNLDINLIIGLSIGLGVGSGCGLLIIAVVATSFTRRIKHRRDRLLKQKFFKENRGHLLEQLVSHNADIAERMIIPLAELDKATNNFDEAREIGGGGHGTVYKGILSDLHVVAIKKSKVEIQREIDEFINEVAILSQINHRNVVRLFGCCLETQVPMLVYEFISNGTLYHHLHFDGPTSLSWEHRLRIATETARAISYLHSAVALPIIHRDIKSHNILLDASLTAKVSDFGASRCIPADRTGITTAVQGTLGYLDPMYYYTGRLTEKSDIYSFGVVLIELLTRRKPYSYRSSDGDSLVAHFSRLFKEGNLLQLVDPQIIDGGKQVNEVVALACTCVNLEADYRPTMRQVGMTLESIRASLQQVVLPPSVGAKISKEKQYAVCYPVIQGSNNESSRPYSAEEEFLLSASYPR